MWLSIAAVVAFSAVYACKVRAFPHDVMLEWVHGERSNFFFAPNIIALMLGCASRARAPGDAALRALFGACGAALVTGSPVRTLLAAALAARRPWQRRARVARERRGATRRP